MCRLYGDVLCDRFARLLDELNNLKLEQKCLIYSTTWFYLVTTIRDWRGVTSFATGRDRSFSQLVTEVRSFARDVKIEEPRHGTTASGQFCLFLSTIITLLCQILPQAVPLSFSCAKLIKRNHVKLEPSSQALTQKFSQNSSEK